MRRGHLGLRLAAAATLTVLVTAGSWTEPRRAEPEPTGRMAATATSLAYARNVYRMLGGPWGEAKVYLDRWPEYADYITGKTEEVNWK